MSFQRRVFDRLELRRFILQHVLYTSRRVILRCIFEILELGNLILRFVFDMLEFRSVIVWFVVDILEFRTVILQCVFYILELRRVIFVDVCFARWGSRSDILWRAFDTLEFRSFILWCVFDILELRSASLRFVLTICFKNVLVLLEVFISASCFTRRFWRSFSRFAWNSVRGTSCKGAQGRAPVRGSYHMDVRTLSC